MLRRAFSLVKLIEPEVECTASDLECLFRSGYKRNSYTVRQKSVGYRSIFSSQKELVLEHQVPNFTPDKIVTDRPFR
jgi:hypothetical protein